jgi:ureidoacrylate peracid hydrolase
VGGAVGAAVAAGGGGDGGRGVNRFGLSRDVPVVAAQTAMIVIDVQNYTMERGAAHVGMTAAEIEARSGYFFREMRGRVLPNIALLQQAARGAGIETLFTVMASHKANGRDLSLDYKISGIFCCVGSWDAQVMDEVAPVGDEILLPKTSSSVFVSTNLHYLLGNMGIRQLIVTGALTDQCVDSAVRDACDLGYLVTVPVDACGTQSAARHVASLANNAGYCRQVTTTALLAEIAAGQA